jgi:hypothetical protein
MHPAATAFISQIASDKAANVRLIASVESGQRIIVSGIDETTERLADAHRRLADASAILAAYA